MSTQHILQVDGLTKKYHGHMVLQDISFAMQRGEYIALIGSNGAGKTTLMKCILSLAATDHGQIRIFGCPHTTPAARRPLAFLPEQFTPPRYLTGKDMLSYLMQLYGIGYNTEKINAMLTKLQLKPSILPRPVPEYSKGTAQMLWLAACLMSEKPLLILDEPMNGLDLKARNIFKQSMSKFKTNNQSLLFSTHLLANLEDFCDRVMILHHGKLLFIGSIAACLGRFSAQTLEEAYLRCIKE